MKVIDDSLTKKMREVNEMIKDVPASDDPIYLMEFNARRKKERAADAAKLAALTDNRTEAEKRMDHIKSFFKEESCLDPLILNKIEQTIEEMEELTPM